ncbi:MAG: hypothetical protein AABZ08_10240 [Planctomycetota bacterium]
MNISGHRWFKAGAITLILFGSVHLLAVYKSLCTTPTDLQEIRLNEALRAFKMELGPFHPTAWHTLNILNASYSALLLYVGIMNLIALGPVAAAGSLRTLTLVNILFTTILFTICLALQFPPPMVFALACMVFFAVSYVKQKTPTHK